MARCRCCLSTVIDIWSSECEHCGFCSFEIRSFAITGQGNKVALLYIGEDSLCFALGLDKEFPIRAVPGFDIEGVRTQEVDGKNLALITDSNARCVAWHSGDCGRAEIVLEFIDTIVLLNLKKAVKNAGLEIGRH